jgi:hypothetical protein
MLAPLPMPVSGFGSSDCSRCLSHLLYMPSRETSQIPSANNLAEYRELPTDDRGLFGFDKRLGPQVDVSDMCENADTGDYHRAQKANDHNL